MRPRLPQVIDIPLSAAATRRARKYNGEYSIALIMRAKTLAYEQHEDEVLVTHIDQARDSLQEQRTAHGWRRTWGGIIGGGLLGAALPGIATELTKGTVPHTGLLAFYIACGLVGPFVIWFTHPRS